MVCFAPQLFTGRSGNAHNYLPGPCHSLEHEIAALRSWQQEDAPCYHQLFNLSAIYTAPWECLFPGQGAEGEQTWLGTGPFPPCCSPATSPWACDGTQGWKQARQTLFIHFSACSEMTGPRLLHAGAFVVMDEVLGSRYSLHPSRP